MISNLWSYSYSFLFDGQDLKQVIQKMMKTSVSLKSIWSLFLMPTIYIKVKPARFTDYVLQDMIVTIFISALPLARESMFLIGFLDSKIANKQCIVCKLTMVVRWVSIDEQCVCICLWFQTELVQISLPPFYFFGEHKRPEFFQQSRGSSQTFFFINRQSPAYKPCL